MYCSKLMRRKILSIPWGALDSSWSGPALGDGVAARATEPGPLAAWPGFREVRQIRRSASSCVLRIEDGDGAFFLKAYWYRDVRAALRGAFRNTWLAPSRPRRELRALERLRDAGVQSDLEAEIAEDRRYGVLREARILTRDFGGPDLEASLLLAPGDAGLALPQWRRLGAFLTAMQDAGVRDPDLVARNVLVRRDPVLTFAKIDASSSWLVRRSRDDRSRARCLETLFNDLERVGAAPTVIQALRETTH